MKKCGYCGRENPDASVQCSGCGTAFIADDEGLADSEESDSENAERTKIVYGAFYFFGGLFVTVATYLAAVSSPYGGHYIIAWGAMAYGAFQVYDGLRGKDDIPSPNETAYLLYECAVSLEMRGRIEEALAIYKEVMKKYPGSDAARDSRKSIEKLAANFLEAVPGSLGSSREGQRKVG